MSESSTSTGSHDAVLQFAVRDHAELRDLLRGLAGARGVIERVRTHIVLEEFEAGADLPCLPLSDAVTRPPRSYRSSLNAPAGNPTQLCSPGQS
ncbi:MAG: Lrp/AsnC ligand binding domain-containing protein [Deinococcus sp.]